MNENSPICPRAPVTMAAASPDSPNARKRKKLTADRNTTMMPTVAISGHGLPSSTRGSNSMPTDTKNNTANASRSGSVSFAACCDSSLSAMISPANSAPSATEIPNTADAA